MNKALIAGGFAALALVLSACDNATTGQVTSKEFKAAHQEYTGDTCYSYRKDMSCAFSMPNYRWVGDTWRINFYNQKDDENGSATVSPQEYAQYKLGDQFPKAR